MDWADRSDLKLNSVEDEIHYENILFSFSRVLWWLYGGPEAKILET